MPKADIRSDLSNKDQGNKQMKSWKEKQVVVRVIVSPGAPSQKEIYGGKNLGDYWAVSLS